VREITKWYGDSLALLAVRGWNLPLLDEPINHLDIPSRESCERAMAVFEGSVLAVVHDRYFIDHLATTVWLMEDGRVRVVPAGEERNACWSVPRHRSRVSKCRRAIDPALKLS
jgi:ATPase subunit of ABC transporter with duplicated ATPase domains